MSHTLLAIGIITVFSIWLSNNILDYPFPVGCTRRKLQVIFFSCVFSLSILFIFISASKYEDHNEASLCIIKNFFSRRIDKCFNYED